MRYLNDFIARIMFLWLKRLLNNARKNDSKCTIYEIKGTGKDYPQYLLFTDVERVRKHLEEI